MMTRTLVRTCVAALLFAGVRAGAQGGPPLAKKVVRDTQPTLQKPKTVSAPPSTVAPSTRRRLPTKADSEPVKPMKRVSAGPDSVRPVAPTAARVDSARGPHVAAPPSRPAPRALTPVLPQASVISDVPPAGATGRCKDGSFVTGPVDQSTCGTNGGLAVRFPAIPAPPRRP